MQISHQHKPTHYIIINQYVQNSDLKNYPLLTTFYNQETYNYKFKDILCGKVYSNINVQNVNQNYLNFFNISLGDSV